MGHFEITMGTSTLGVDDSLRDSFTVEVGQFVDKVEVLEKNRAVFAGQEGVLVVVNGRTGGGGQGVAGVVGHGGVLRFCFLNFWISRKSLALYSKKSACARYVFPMPKEFGFF